MTMVALARTGPKKPRGIMAAVLDNLGNPTDLLSAIPAAVFQTRINYSQNKFLVSYISHGAVGLLGLDAARFDPGGFSVNDLLALIHPADLSKLGAKFAESTRSVTRYQVQCRLILPGAGIRWLDIVADPQSQQGGWIVWQGLITDITAVRQAEAGLQLRLDHMAAHDALTGLPNRLTFEKKLREACDSADDTRVTMLCFMDLDRFKIMNDSAGHAAGDAFLRKVGALIQSVIGERDFTARLGGDEFALLLYDVLRQRPRIVRARS